MKRIAIFCDGTWNRLSAEQPTNVVLAAQSVLPADETGTTQLAFYSEGVGTTYLVNRTIETALAGAFGWGLFDKIAEAYRFLAFNWRPGDEIFIFGFSRGAFTARSLAGLIRKCGIIPKARASQIAAAFAFYKNHAIHPDDPEAQQFRLRHSPETVMKSAERSFREDRGDPGNAADRPLFSIRYVGVWDTVGALGVPRHTLFEMIVNTARRYQFHDTQLSSIVEAARHAVAIDEDRRSFEPALWDNLDELNAASGHHGHYQQLWFPGDHGAVGGGSDVSGLSHAALLWVIDGAERMGLRFDAERLGGFRAATDPFAPLTGRTKRNWLGQVYRRAPRQGPSDRQALSDTTLKRLAGPADDPSWEPYRPAALRKLLDLPASG
ncbi:DUF2235 domain-containing protein [Pararhizobium haloflavum]|uniref:DUF2235 domain-containing protein n=1 Tax=Pararhizobium haloflavum TaxID=2037914 RepID=UPI0012FFF4E3|nr:DUF2235 domain-containing protein [Pararhizobium haloflavum]